MKGLKIYAELRPDSISTYNLLGYEVVNDETTIGQAHDDLETIFAVLQRWAKPEFMWFTLDISKPDGPHLLK